MITKRIEAIRQQYVINKPCISTERAYLWTKSHKETEGLPVCIRRARAFYDTCRELTVSIFDGELIVGAAEEFRRCGILTPEFSSQGFPKIPPKSEWTPVFWTMTPSGGRQSERSHPIIRMSCFRTVSEASPFPVEKPLCNRLS